MTWFFLHLLATKSKIGTQASRFIGGTKERAAVVHERNQIKNQSPTITTITDSIFGGMHDTDHSNDSVWTNSSHCLMGGVSDTTTEASKTDGSCRLMGSVSDAASEACEISRAPLAYKDGASSLLVRHSMQTNNHGLDLLISGKLHEARDVLSEADRLYQTASFLHCDDDDDCDSSQEYQSDWVNIRSLVDVIGQNNEMKQTLNHLFLYGLRIRDPIHIINKNNSTNTANSKPEILRTSRMDWSIRFNLSLVTQILGIVTSNGIAMVCRADSFDLYELLAADIVAWYDGRAPLDAAILVMAVYNNQGSMYRQLQVVHQVEAYWGRMGRILNSSRSLQAHPLCKTLMQNLTFLMNERTGPAPAA
eukprot:scaffold22578_cov164-Cylindrotheca_fusiformis.AAC.17